MELLLITLGALLIIAVAVDALTTTVAVGSGGGWMTRRLSTGLWTAARHVVGDRHDALRRVGVAVTLTSIAAWLLLAWLGWTLVFAASSSAVVDATSGEPATFGQRVYFAGYTLLTLGNGDYRPEGLVWQVATVLTVGNGFVLVTLAITYLVPLASAVTEMRQLAASVNALGATPDAILTGAFDGDGLQQLQGDLSGLEQQLLLHQQRHLTYPVLHYFHSTQPGTSAPLQLVLLDEALTLLEAGVAADVARPQRLIQRLRAALNGYVDVLSNYVSPASQPPPAVPLDALRAAGIPTVDQQTYRARVDELEPRRRLLAGALAHDAWEWTHVTGEVATDG